MHVSHSLPPYTLLKDVFISGPGKYTAVVPEAALRKFSSGPIFSAFSVFNAFSDTGSAILDPFPDPAPPGRKFQKAAPRAAQT